MACARVPSAMFVTALAENELFDFTKVCGAATAQRETAPTMKRKLNAEDVPEVVDSIVGKESRQGQPTFAILGLDSRLLRAAYREKFSTPTPVQKKAIPLALAGKDVLGMCVY
jgi:hypothetical protein